MSDIAIKVENLSKLYRLGNIGTGSLGSDLTRWWASIRGREDPFTKIATTNDRSQKTKSDYVWSLRNIDFEIKKGDAIGVIGKNGAGKSTLLKILSRTTSPTVGNVKIDGRVASLLEVGTGFHGDLTGRENVYMNGAILGMSRSEVTRKLDEIIDFSGVAAYIDTPVKRYSSGMYVRLAFAVSAHLEPDIMIVDEVLAVGDAEFQKKCIGKMNDVNHEGRTIIFVSHSMATIKQLCTKAIFLKNGELKHSGDLQTAFSLYLDHNEIDSETTFIAYLPNPHLEVAITKIALKNSRQEDVNNFDTGERIYVYLEFEAIERAEQVEFSLRLKNSNAVSVIFSSLSDHFNRIPVTVEPGKYVARIEIDHDFLVPDEYYLSIYSHFRNIKAIENKEDVLKFTVEEMGSVMAPYGKNAIDIACVMGGSNWSLSMNN